MINNNRFFLQVPLEVLSVPPQYHDVHIDATINDIHRTRWPAAPQSLSPFQREVYSNIVGELLQRQSVAEQTASHVTPTDVVHFFFPRTAIHCECAQVVYHSLHPNLKVSNYIGLSEPPCFACNTYIATHNGFLAAADPSRIRFRTRLLGRYDSLPWAFPSLQPSTLDDSIRKRMISDFLGPALFCYVDERWKTILVSKKIDPPGQSMSRSEFIQLIGKLCLHLPFCLLLNNAFDFSH